MKSGNKIDQLLQAQDINKDVTLIQNYNRWRSKHPDDVIFILEGNEDYAFYSVMLKKTIQNVSLKNITPYILKGKKNVLKLHKELQHNSQERTKKVLFFVDRDFDKHVEDLINDKLYITPTYSIENLLVHENALKELLKGEYCCNDENANEDIQKIVETFKKQREKFISSNTIKKLNLILYYAIHHKIPKNKIQKDITKIIKISLNDINDLISVKDIYNFLGLENEISEEELNTLHNDFKKLEPLIHWRGKFIYQFFIKFLSLLKEDRIGKEPIMFKNKRTVTFCPKTDIIRPLSEMTDIPLNLYAFFKKHKTFFIQNNKN